MMSITLLKKAILSMMVAINPYGAEEYVICEVAPLEEHGFSQWGEIQEYVCVDEEDYIILEDEFDEMRVGDDVFVGLNEWGEVIDYAVLIQAEDK